MNSRIQIRHLGGSAAHPAGSRQDFEIARVRLGRGGDCEVRYDAHADRSVSTAHAVLVVDGDQARVVDTDSRNGVYVNGERIERERALRSGDVVRLGAEGPQFEIVLPGLSAAEQTIATGGPNAAPPTEPTPPRDRSVPPGMQGKKSVGLNTLMGVVDRTVQRERRKMLSIVLMLVAVVLWLLFGPDARPAEWRDVVARPIRSIYVCALLENGNARPFGTAWSVGDGMLATNSHVAIEFENKPSGTQFLVRSCSTPPVDLRIEKVTLHPAFRRWKDLVARYDPYIAGQGFQRMMPPACDVALLHVHPEDVDKLAPALEIASRQDVLALTPGDPVALVGYPMEAQAGSGVNMDAPYPQLRDGTVSRLTNYFLGADTSERRQLVGLDLKSAGGASGSPVFNRSGRVVAVNSAGDYLLLGSDTRIGSGGAYGQRVDVLLDLIEGMASEADELSVGRLEREFLEQFRKGVAQPLPFATFLAGLLLEKGEALGPPYKTEFEIAQPEAAGAVELDGFEAPERGDYVRIVLPTWLPEPPVVETLANGRWRKGETVRYFSVMRWTLAANARLKTRVWLSRDADLTQPLGYVLFWFPVKK